jgi:hypothetical protein
LTDCLRVFVNPLIFLFLFLTEETYQIFLQSIWMQWISEQSEKDSQKRYKTYKQFLHLIWFDSFFTSRKIFCYFAVRM